MSVQMRTILDVADNSGARKLQVILPLGGGLGKKGGRCYIEPDHDQGGLTSGK